LKSSPPTDGINLDINGRAGRHVLVQGSSVPSEDGNAHLWGAS